MTRKILIVDDDPDIQVTLRKRLELHGFACFSANTVDMARLKLAKDPPDLILLDLGLEGADGTAFLKTAAQSLPQGVPVPPILVLSCYNDKEIVDYVMNEGAIGFIAKPYDAEVLLSTINDYLHD